MPELNEVRNDSDQVAYPKIGFFIDGKWIYDRDPYIELRNPSTESPLGPVPKATDEDLKRALDAAARGFEIWRDTPPVARARTMQKALALLRERTGEIAQILTVENGKTLADARAEIERSQNFLEWEIGQSFRAYGIIAPGEPMMQKYILRQPIGPVVAFTPWNVPMASAARKTSAALAAGCSVILKAAEETPGTACAFVKCYEDAGLPAGVLNLVFGDPAHISSTLIASPITRLVTFTGSTAVGKQLMQMAAKAMKPVLMELGGNGPVLIGDDVDAAAVGKLAAEAKSRSSGQICASVSRFIVHKNSYDEFVSSFAGTFGNLRVGDGFEPGVQMGPLTTARRLVAVQALVDDAIQRGARVATGGRRIGNQGYFFEPTVLAEVPLDSNIMKTEPFGPLASCVAVSNLEEALSVANSVPVGLVGYAFTNSLEEAEQITRRLQCGVVSINNFGTPDADMPFGGVKDSGIGREGGATSLDSYLVTKTILQSTVRT